MTDVIAEIEALSDGVNETDLDIGYENAIHDVLAILRKQQPVKVSLKEYVDMAQTESNLEFRKTFVQPTVYYQAMEAAVKAILNSLKQQGVEITYD